MNRNSSTQALILHCKQTGESNRLVTLLTHNLGIVKAVQYGGAKSKLRSLISPFHSGTVWLYTDTQKNSVKITDFDVQKFRSGLRESLYKSWAASLCAELLITTHSGGETADFDGIYTLTNGFLDGLELSSETECQKGVLRFLWRYLLFLGLQSDTQNCVKCGESLKIMSKKEPQNETVFYSSLDSGFVCNECGHDFNSHIRAQFVISVTALDYLQIITEKTPKQARNTPLNQKDVLDLQHLLFYLTEKAAGVTLKTCAQSILL